MLLWLQAAVAAAVASQPSSTAPTQCAGFDVTAGASCNNATQLPGNPRVPAASVQECCSACTAHSGCETFVWEDPEEAPTNTNCRLAGHCPELHLRKEKKTTGRRSGGPVPPPPPPPPGPPTPPGTCSITVHSGNSCPNATVMPSGIVKVQAATVADCCAACEAHGPECGTFIFTDPEDAPAAAASGNCLLKGSCPGLKPTQKTTGTRPVPPPGPPPPPLPPPPLPPPVPPGTQKNVIVLLTDDQDLRLGSMRAMPYTMEHIGSEGANISNFFVHTPICCPSRSSYM